MRRYIKEIPFILLLISALMLRCHYLGFESRDYTDGFGQWYDYLKAHGIGALKVTFSNYSTSYLLLLYIATLLPLAKIVSIKLIPILFDFFAAFVMYRMVKIRYSGGNKPFWAALALLWAPTVVVNGALWGQCDCIYASFALFSLYAWSRQRLFASFVLFGVALSFKLQAIFLLPLYLVFLARKKVPPYYILIPALVYVLSVLPSVVLGRTWREVAGVYLEQSRVTDQFLCMAAPNIYHWLPGHRDPLIPGIPLARKVGTVLWAMGLAVSMAWMIRRRGELNLGNVLRYGLFFALFSPFLLPNMHERYFFLADVLSILYAFYFPRRFFVPFMVLFASFFSYWPFLYYTIPIPMGMLSLLMGSALFVVTWDALRDPYVGTDLGVNEGSGGEELRCRGSQDGSPGRTLARSPKRSPRIVRKPRQVSQPRIHKRRSK
jgi:Gpi18-like mannosyltransferase